MSLNDGDIRLKWDNDSLLAISMTRAKFAAKGAGGMCGNYDGNASNDIPTNLPVTNVGNYFKLPQVRKSFGIILVQSVHSSFLWVSSCLNSVRR